MTHALSALILSALVFGLFQAHNRKLHVRVMSIALTADIALVLYLAIGRKVLGKINPETLSPLLIVHLTVALSTVILYVYAVRFGLRLLRGDESARPGMRRIAWIVMPLRVSVLFTSLALAYWN